MPYSCRHCGRTYAAELDRDLHAERCGENRLVCRVCGERFDERRATTDGWHYECPNPDCDATGIGEGLRRVGERPLARQS